MSARRSVPVPAASRSPRCTAPGLRPLLAVLVASAMLAACGGGGGGGDAGQGPAAGNGGTNLPGTAGGSQAGAGDGTIGGDEHTPGADQPGAGNPGAGNPGSGNPGSGNPGAGEPGAGSEPISGEPPRPWTFRTAEPAQAQWSAIYPLPQVPAAAANLPDGRILFWSAEDRFYFSDNEGQTYTSIFDPVSGLATDRLVSETNHNMFCPGTTNLPDGRLLVTGGIGSPMSSIYDPQTNSWSATARMNIPRGYQANVLTADSQVLTVGGSWSGPTADRTGELWNEADGWRILPNVKIDTMVGPDPGGIYRADNHMWLFATADNRVLHAGPSVNMNWITTGGDGSIRAAGGRGDDSYSQNGNAAMYDVNRVLKTGGAPAYENTTATRASYSIAIGSEPTVTRLTPMSYPRAFHNSVVLPNGQVVVVGGQTQPVPFSDNTTIFIPEIWDPVTRQFSTMPAMQVPRNYHSVALLLTDGRVMVGGGGLCGAGCNANHPNLQILTPPYLLDSNGTAARQARITRAPAEAALGNTISVDTDMAVASFVLMRSSSTTHTVNNDQRRIPVSHRSASATRHSIELPTNPGIVSPGDYMLFALDARGVPSISQRIRISTAGVPMLANPGTVWSSTNAAVDLTMSVRGGGAASFSASGMPPGVSFDAASARFSGTPSAAGNWRTRVTARAGAAASSTEFDWRVTTAPAVRFVQIQALTDIGGANWAAIAEVDVLDPAGETLPRAGWTAQASSAVAGRAASAVLDGSAASWWQSATGATNQLHSLTLDLGTARTIGGLRILPRPGGQTAGVIGQYRILVSTDNSNWQQAGASGDFAQWGNPEAARTVLLGNVAIGHAAVQSSTEGSAAAGRALDGYVGGNAAQGSVAITTVQSNPWWQLDLGQPHTLDAIRLWNRSDCCTQRLANLTVFVSRTDMSARTPASLTADPGVWRSQIVTEVGREVLIRGTARGRFVRVQLTGNTSLALAEVEVHGQPDATGTVTLAEGRPVISEAGRAVALALDGRDSLAGAIQYEVDGLPEGLRLDPARGVIGGTPNQVGASVIRVSVRNAAGHSAEMRFLWIVEPAPASAAGPAALAQPGLPLAQAGGLDSLAKAKSLPGSSARATVAGLAEASDGSTSTDSGSAAFAGWQPSAFDTPEAIRGAALYYGRAPLEGRMAGQQQALPAVASRCANCHEGKAGTAAATLTTSTTSATARPELAAWEINVRLDALSLQTSRSRRGGPASSFDAASLCTLARTGVDPAAILVDPIMPRFTLSDDDCRDLWAFLSRRT